MNRIMINLVALVVMLTCIIGTALAGNDSYSIMVSCTIPAIPGVNVPLVATPDSEKQETREEAQIEKEQTLPSAQEGTLVLTKTIYSR